MSNDIRGNLFFLTGVGQLRNIKGFINQYNAKNNIAVILYTEQNLDVVENIKKSIDKKMFDDVQFIKLPNKVLIEKKEKSKEIYTLLENSINENKEKYNVRNLFLCSFTNYYIFFKTIIKDKEMAINLLEEGLSTYRLYLEDSEEKRRKISLQDILKDFKKMIKKFIAFIKSIIVFIITILSFICRVNLLYYLKELRRKINKCKYGLIHKFDNVYVCYPELIEKINSNIGPVKKLDFNYKDENVKFTSDQDKENVLFINQKYGIKYKDHFPIIFSILRDMGIKKVYFKFHPREQIENFEKIFDDAKKEYPELEIITINQTNHIPVENLINNNKITKIIALTSSSLFYSKLVKNDIRAISIAEEYKNRCIANEIPEKRMKTFLEDYEMIDRIFGVEQYKFEEHN